MTSIFRFGSPVMGSSSSYSAFEADGTLAMTGGATVWEDLRVPGLAMKTNASAPNLENFVSAGLQCYAFDGGSTLEQVYFAVQLPHSYKEGSAIVPHVHWAPTNASAGTVVWSLEYSWASIGSIMPSTTIVSATSYFSGVTWTHKLTSFGTISGANKKISSMIMCRLFRNPSSARDTYGYDAALMEFDLHYESDTLGSRATISK